MLRGSARGPVPGRPLLDRRRDALRTRRLGAGDGGEHRASAAVRRGFVAAGGTALHPALVEALRTQRAPGALPRMVVFLTDGMPTLGETDPARIVDDVSRISGDARLFVFGVGDDVNTTFLDLLAQRNRGMGEYFQDGAEMEARLSAFYDRVAFPLLTDLRLSLEGMGAYDVYPRDLGHLFKGQQLLVVGRYRSSGSARVVLNGRVSHERSARSFAYEVRVPAADRTTGSSRLSSRRARSAYLLDEIRLHGERAGAARRGDRGSRGVRRCDPVHELPRRPGRRRAAGVAARQRGTARAGRRKKHAPPGTGGRAPRTSPASGRRRRMYDFETFGSTALTGRTTIVGRARRRRVSGHPCAATPGSRRLPSPRAASRPVGRHGRTGRQDRASPPVDARGRADEHRHGRERAVSSTVARSSSSTACGSTRPIAARYQRSAFATAAKATSVLLRALLRFATRSRSVSA